MVWPHLKCDFYRYWVFKQFLVRLSPGIKGALVDIEVSLSIKQLSVQCMNLPPKSFFFTFLIDDEHSKVCTGEHDAMALKAFLVLPSNWCRKGGIRVWFKTFDPRRNSLRLFVFESLVILWNIHSPSCILLAPFIHYIVNDENSLLEMVRSSS